jgi:hypothetical protein
MQPHVREREQNLVHRLLRRECGGDALPAATVCCSLFVLSCYALITTLHGEEQTTMQIHTPSSLTEQLSKDMNVHAGQPRQEAV